MPRVPQGEGFDPLPFSAFALNLLGQVSITFDPFMYLTLPLPVNKKWRHEIYYIPWNTEKIHVKIPVVLNRDATFRDLRALVGRWMGANPDNVNNYPPLSGHSLTWTSRSSLLSRYSHIASIKTSMICNSAQKWPRTTKLYAMSCLATLSNRATTPPNRETPSLCLFSYVMPVLGVPHIRHSAAPALFCLAIPLLSQSLGRMLVARYV